MGLIWAPFKCLLLHWDSEQVRFCMHPLRTVSVSCSPPALKWKSCCLEPACFSKSCFSNQMSWGLTFQHRSPMWGSGPSLPGEDLCACDGPSICGSLTWLGVGVLTVPHLCSSYPPCCGSCFISLVAQSLSTSLQVVLIYNCSVNSCSFGGLWEEVSSGSSFYTIVGKLSKIYI